MTSQAKPSQAQLSSQEGLQVLEEQDLEKITGGVLDPVPLLSKPEKEAAGKESPHPNNDSYLPPSDVDLLRKLRAPYVEGVSLTEGPNGQIIRRTRN
jgi:hypothetical protein